jgi:MYXO-CTERM domain-containing protein
VAGYRDFITYTGADSPPPVLEFHVGLSGDLFTSSMSTAGVGILGYANSVFELEGALPGNAINIRQSTDGNEPHNTRLDIAYDAYDTLSISPIVDPGSFLAANHVEATWHIDVPHDPTTGGYRVAIMLQATTGDVYFELSGKSLSDFSHTLTLNSITLTDGTIVDPSSLRFESGLSFAPSAVPEPGTLTLAGFGAVGLVLGALRRRRQTKQQ